MMLNVPAPRTVAAALVLLASLVACSCCRRPSPEAPSVSTSPAAPNDINATAAPSNPAPEATTEAMDPRPPWEQLLAERAVFSGATAGLCASSHRPKVLVVLGAEAHRRELAERAGCRALPLPGMGEVEVCCPADFEAPPATRHGGGKSCEQAQTEYVAAYDPNDPPGGFPEPTANTYAVVLNHGSYLSACQLPDTWGVSVCAAVQYGRVQGVTVRTIPASAVEADCIAAAVRDMAFPSHPRMDIARTRFAPTK